MNAKEVTRRNEVTCESPLPGWMPNCALSAKKWASSDTHRRAVVSSIRVLFVIVALLLVADLHSSTLAAHGQWEMNPFLAALAEHVGTRAALLGVKVADLAMLAGLYALWRRSNAHVPVTLVLIISAFEYAETVMNNYQG